MGVTLTRFLPPVERVLSDREPVQDPVEPGSKNLPDKKSRDEFLFAERAR